MRNSSHALARRGIGQGRAVRVEAPNGLDRLTYDIDDNRTEGFSHDAFLRSQPAWAGDQLWTVPVSAAEFPGGVAARITGLDLRGYQDMRLVVTVGSPAGPLDAQLLWFFSLDGGGYLDANPGDRHARRAQPDAVGTVAADPGGAAPDHRRATGIVWPGWRRRCASSKSPSIFVASTRPRRRGCCPRRLRPPKSPIRSSRSCAAFPRPMWRRSPVLALADRHRRSAASRLRGNRAWWLTPLQTRWRSLEPAASPLPPIPPPTRSLLRPSTAQLPTPSARDDARLANARTPTAHAASHKAGGGDVIRLDELGAPTDVATLNASASAHGLCPKLDSNAAHFLNGTGAWSPAPYDFLCGIVGLPASGEVVPLFVALRPFRIPANATGSRLKAGTAASGSSVFAIQKNSSEVLTATVAASGTTATFAGIRLLRRDYTDDPRYGA